MLEESLPDPGHSQSQGSEAGACFMYLCKRKGGAIVAGVGEGREHVQVRAQGPVRAKSGDALGFLFR